MAIIKYLATVLFVIFFLSVSAQENCDTLFWSARKLTWNDFKTFSDTSKSSATQTVVKIAYSVTQPDDFAWIKVNTYFLPCRSFTKNNNDAAMLQHEQLHFDIAEYYKRLFEKKVSEISAVQDIFPSAVKALFREISEQRKSTENEYDAETNKGANTEAQKTWNDKIAKLLFETEMYNDPIVKVKVKS